jgi:hypothetical protein
MQITQLMETVTIEMLRGVVKPRIHIPLFSALWLVNWLQSFDTKTIN